MSFANSDRLYVLNSILPNCSILHTYKYNLNNLYFLLIRCFLLTVYKCNSNYIYFNREERLQFIRCKYVEKRWCLRTCADAAERIGEVEHAVNNGELLQLLQAYGEGADLLATIPSSVS